MNSHVRLEYISVSLEVQQFLISPSQETEKIFNQSFDANFSSSTHAKLTVLAFDYAIHPKTF